MNESTPAVLERSQIESIVASAGSAPSLFNAQPWQFRTDGRRFELSVATERAPAGVDPKGREVHLSCGAALFNLRLAVAAVGREPIVHLLPIPDDPTVIAHIRLGGVHEVTDIEKRLIAAVPDRHTSREPFARNDVPYEDLAHLMAAAEAEGAFFDIATGKHRERLSHSLVEADEALRQDAGAVRETVRWVFDSHTDGTGIPRESLGPASRDKAAGVRDFALGVAVEGRAEADFEPDPLLAVLSTHGDSPINWLRAGMALERVLLEATDRGISVGILSQAGEIPTLRPTMRDPVSGWGHPHLVLRLGYGPKVPSTPRVPVRRLVEIVDSLD